MALLVAVRGWEPAAWISRLSAALPDHDIRNYLDTFGNRTDIRYLVAWKVGPASLGPLPNLEVIFSLGAGVDHLLATPDLPDVPIVRVVDRDLTMRMSEWVVLQVLMHHRKQHLYEAQQKRRDWRPHDQPPARAVRVGILGLGVLGADVAEVLSRIGFQVAGWSRSPKSIEGIKSYSGPDGLDAMLARSDILVNLLPQTAETRGILNRSLFAKLSTDGGRHPLCDAPILINAGRGGAQVETDIVSALDDGTLFAASLDVFQQEPLAEASALWTHPKAIVTPHIAADSDPDALSAYVAAQIRAYEAGEGLTNVVDRTAGY